VTEGGQPDEELLDTDADLLCCVVVAVEEIEEHRHVKWVRDHFFKVVVILDVVPDPLLRPLSRRKSHTGRFDWLCHAHGPAPLMFFLTVVSWRRWSITARGSPIGQRPQSGPPRAISISILVM
jgi:hypothetical protein